MSDKIEGWDNIIIDEQGAFRAEQVTHPVACYYCGSALYSEARTPTCRCCQAKVYAARSAEIEVRT